MIRPSISRGTALAISLVFAGVCQAGRPLTIDDAAPTDHHRWQLEAGVAIAKDGGDTPGAIPLTLAYGVVPNVELAASFGGLFGIRGGISDELADGCSDLVFAAKWRFLNHEANGLSLAIAPALKLPTADEDEGLGSGCTDVNLTLIATKDFPNTAIDVNVGHTIVGEDTDLWHYGFAVRQDVSSGWWLVGEIFATTVASGPTSIAISTGFQWEFRPGLSLDAAIGTGIREAADLTATVGLTWVF